MRTLAAAFFLVLVSGCSSSPSVDRTPAAPTPDKAPFSAPPAAAHEIRVTVDTRAAKEILGALSRQRFEPSDVKVIEDMEPVKLAIQDSGRSEEVFQRDFAAAFDPETRTAVFDFATVRRERERWEVLLDAVSSGREQIERLSANRAAAMLPGDRPIQTRVLVFITFGLAGLADHMSVKTPDGTPAILVDLARVLGDAEPDPASNQVSRLVRLISGEAYQQAWAAYRRGNVQWTTPLPALGSLEPLVRNTAETGPVALFTIEDSFFPVSTWLKEPMQRSMNELNRMGERLLEGEKDLDVRIALTAEVKRPDFIRRVAAPAGAFMEDGILQADGIEGLRAALASGPFGFFQAYQRATERDRDLPPLAKMIVQRLNAAAAPAAR